MEATKKRLDVGVVRPCQGGVGRNGWAWHIIKGYHKGQTIT